MQQRDVSNHINQDLTAGIARATGELDRQAFDELVTRIKGFNFDDANATDLERVSRAAKLVTQEAVRRYEEATKLHDQANHKLACANVAEAVAEVEAVHRKAPFFSLRR